MCQSYFDWEILPHIKPSGKEKAEANQLFQLTAANHGKHAMSMYVELDVDLLGIVVSKGGVLITQEPNEILDECHKTKFPGIIGWNVILLTYQVFVQKYRSSSLESSWTALPLTPLDSSSFLNRAQQFSINEDGLLGTVWIGNTNQPICVPGNTALTIPGRLYKNTRVPSGTPCLIDTAAVDNLPQGISVNLCLTYPKSNVVPVIVINQNN